MKYLILAFIVFVTWIINLLITMVFHTYTKGLVKEYEKKLVDNGNNIFIYGLFGVGGLLLGNYVGGWISYLIMGLGFIIALVGVLPLLLMFFTTVPLTFNKNHNGIGNTGKLSDWIFFTSVLLENALVFFIVFNMYSEFI